MVGSPVFVGMAELQAINGAAMLTCLGLGSCVSVCVLDPVANVSGMAHIMLPASLPDDYPDKPARFADIGVPELINSMEKLGADRSRIVAAVAGGASVRCEREHFEIGRRNAEAVVKQLENSRIKCVGHDLGRTSS